MSEIKRRDFLKASAGVAAGVALGAGSALVLRQDACAQCKLTPEKGAKLRVLRWKRFVQGDEDVWLANTKKFTEKTGVEVRVDTEGWEDVRPKAAVAANVGSGPDIIIGTIRRRAPVSGQAASTSPTSPTTSAAKYGGWYRRARGVRHATASKWIAMPMGCAGNCARLPREPHEGGRLRRNSRRTPPASSSCARR